MTMSNFQGHAPIAGILKYNFSYSCVTVDKILTDMPRRACTLCGSYISFLLAQKIGTNAPQPMSKSKRHTKPKPTGQPYPLPNLLCLTHRDFSTSSLCCERPSQKDYQLVK